MEKENNYKGGAIIIGSLLWEKSTIRDNWRNTDLLISDKIPIELPIRYGRISNTRNCTYSMVFSHECLNNDKLGKGFFVPFAKDKLSLNELIEFSKHIINAEYNSEKNLNRNNWGWGCLVLLINPLLKDTEKGEVLMKKWKEKYSNGFSPCDYKVGSEQPIVTKSGMLEVEWNDKLNEFDFAIGTATKPELNKYPEASDIALKMVVNNYYEYFEENKKNKIETFQDNAIETELLKSKKTYG